MKRKQKKQRNKTYCVLKLSEKQINDYLVYLSEDLRGTFFGVGLIVMRNTIIYDRLNSPHGELGIKISDINSDNQLITIYTIISMELIRILNSDIQEQISLQRLHIELDKLMNIILNEEDLFKYNYILSCTKR